MIEEQNLIDLSNFLASCKREVHTKVELPAWENGNEYDSAYGRGYWNAMTTAIIFIGELLDGKTMHGYLEVPEEILGLDHRIRGTVERSGVDIDHNGCFTCSTSGSGRDHPHPKVTGFSDLMYCMDCRKWFRKVESTEPLVSYWKPCSSLWVRLFYRHIYKEILERIKETK